MPTTEELIEFYQGFSFQIGETRDLVRSLPNIKKSLVYFLGNPKQGARFLDFGGGVGVYSKAAKDLGWEAELFDYDQGAVEFAETTWGVRAYSSLDSLNGEYDVIFAFHVIEHWNEIDQSIAFLKQHMSRDGMMVFATPNAKSVEKKVRTSHLQKYSMILSRHGVDMDQIEDVLGMDDSITCWDPPRHLYAFTPNALEAIGIRHGLRPRIVTGYNISTVFEPRQYVVPTPLKIIEDGIISGWPRTWKEIKMTVRRARESYRQRRELHRLQNQSPDLGEQLYAIYRRMD